MKYLQEVGGKRENIYLRNIMTPQSRLEVLYMADVKNAQVGNVLTKLHRVGYQHALVVDLNARKPQMVRGIFSLKQIGI